MNALQLFKYAENSVRTGLYENGEPWFVAKDICDILGIKNHRTALDKLNNKQRIVEQHINEQQMYGVHGLDSISQNFYTGKVDIIDSKGRRQEIHTVTEAGLYSLVCSSNKKEAILFQHWLTYVVLPTLRKEGSYELKLVDPLSFTSDIKYPSHYVAKLLNTNITALYEVLREHNYVHSENYRHNVATMSSLKRGLLVIDEQIRANTSR